VNERPLGGGEVISSENKGLLVGGAGEIGIGGEGILG